MKRRLAWRSLILRFWWLPPVSFYAMELCHEAGHLLAGWLTGARLECVELLPWRLSRTAFVENPHPLIVVWAGPLVGIGVPLLLAWIFRKRCYGRCFQFFAGFALVANGVYIGLGGFARIGDALEMLRYGTPRGVMVLFGVFAAFAGLGLWHDLGRRGEADAPEVE